MNIEKEKKLLANIGLIIKKIRIQRGITRDILAIKSKISLRYLAKLELGNGHPTISVLKNIAYALNITFKELMFTENSDNKKNLVKNKIDQPLHLGYSNVGEVIKVGDIVVLPTQGFTKLPFEGNEYWVGPENQVLAKINE